MASNIDVAKKKKKKNKSKEREEKVVIEKVENFLRLENYDAALKLINKQDRNYEQNQNYKLCILNVTTLILLDKSVDAFELAKFMVTQLNAPDPSTKFESTHWLTVFTCLGCGHKKEGNFSEAHKWLILARDCPMPTEQKVSFSVNANACIQPMFEKAKEYCRCGEYEKASEYIDGSYIRRAQLDPYYGSDVWNLKIQILLKMEKREEALNTVKWLVTNSKGLEGEYERFHEDTASALGDDADKNGEVEKAIHWYGIAEKKCTSNKDKMRYTELIGKIRDKEKQNDVATIDSANEKDSTLASKLAFECTSANKLKCLPEQSDASSSIPPPSSSEIKQQLNVTLPSEPEAIPSLIKPREDIPYSSISSISEGSSPNLDGVSPSSSERKMSITSELGVKQILTDRVYLGWRKIMGRQMEKTLIRTSANICDIQNFQNSRDEKNPNEYLLRVDDYVELPKLGSTLVCQKATTLSGFFQPLSDEFRLTNPETTDAAKKKWWDIIADDFTTIFRDVIRGLNLYHSTSEGEGCLSELRQSEIDIFIIENHVQGRILPCLLSEGKKQRSAESDIVELRRRMFFVISLPFKETYVNSITYGLPAYLQDFIQMVTIEKLNFVDIGWLIYHPWVWTSEERFQVLYNLKYAMKRKVIKKSKLATIFFRSDKFFKYMNWWDKKLGEGDGVYFTIYKHAKESTHIASYQSGLDIVRYMNAVFEHINDNATEKDKIYERYEVEQYLSNKFPDIYIDLFASLYEYSFVCAVDDSTMNTKDCLREVCGQMRKMWC